jgi:hypothetical protein
MAQTFRSNGTHGTGPFHAVAGIFIGQMGWLPREPEIQSVLTVAEQPGIVADDIRHRHLPLSYQTMVMTDLEAAVEWVLVQVATQRTVLVRSEGGLQRPGLVVALAVLALGGHYQDAVTCVRHAHTGALTDFRYLEILKAGDAVMRKRRTG